MRCTHGQSGLVAAAANARGAPNAMLAAIITTIGLDDAILSSSACFATPAERDFGKRPAPPETMADAAHLQRVHGLFDGASHEGRRHFTMNLPAMPLLSRPLQPQAYSPGLMGTKKISASPSLSISIS